MVRHFFCKLKNLQIGWRMVGLVLMKVFVQFAVVLLLHCGILFC